ncbi:ER membrane glycoprotein subunit of the GPI transamidase complex-like protein [Ciborinia camelliae]|nr:ER membrane glycoprotein subunit of the GPI transamidase complex-like protein [Ciborinia camelliae]
MASIYLYPLEAPVRTLILCFTLWKISFLLTAACSPGPGYDTSTSLLLSSLQSIGKKKLPSAVRYLVGKLVRWDAIYFVRVSNRGYLYEQEWAFGSGASNRALGHDVLILISGIIFGVAVTFRSNALLNGLLLLEEAFRTFISLGNGFNITTIRRLIITGLGGICVGMGFLIPQNNGLFNYWTLSNIPLFLLAMPMITILGVSSNWGVRDSHLPQISVSPKKETRPPIDRPPIDRPPIDRIEHGDKVQIIRNLALSQLLLTVYTVTSGHVQIITRISSSYPVYLWYMAALVGKGNGPTVTMVGRFMIIYAGIQGGLFSSFLPPA